MKLTFEKLAPYLPYDLKVQWINTLANKLSDGRFPETFVNEILTVKNYASLIDARKSKPILRPLSDLTKEIEHNGEKFIVSEKIAIHLFDKAMREYLLGGGINGIPFWVSQKYFEYHFDVFGLIDEGLAIDINTLKP